MQISDPQAIKALAHPLRLDLLELLAAGGPATAARCGRVLGVPQANCSFHLRQLAKYGFVEDAGPGRDRRERTWQVPDPRPTLRIGTDGGAGAAVLGRELERVVVERELQAILDYGERREADAARWGRMPGVVTSVAVVSAEEAAEIRDKWHALLEPYLARTAADSAEHRAGQRHVRYFMAATPLPDLEAGDSDNESDD